MASSSSGQLADLLPLSTPSNPEVASGSRRCSVASAASEQPSSASSPAYLSAMEDLSEVGMSATPAASSVTLNQTQVEIVGVIDRKSGFYAIGVSTRARIVYGSWPSVSPLTTGPTAHGVSPSRHFKVEAEALQYMVEQGFKLPHYVLSDAPTAIGS